MFTGDRLEGIEAENWVNGKPDLSQGTYLIHFWTSTCLRCHTEIEILAEITRRRDITLVTLHQPRYQFEDHQHLDRTLERKKINAHAAHRPEKQDWFADHSPKKLLIEDGEVKYHSSQKHDLSELFNQLGIDKGFEPGHQSEEKHLGLENSALKPENRFHGEKHVEKGNMSRKDISISGKWKQTEKYLEAVENAEITFTTNKEDIFLVSDPEDSIKDVKVIIDYEENKNKRVKSKGIDHLVSMEEGEKQVILKPENGLKLFKLDLV